MNTGIVFSFPLLFFFLNIPLSSYQLIFFNQTKIELFFFFWHAFYSECSCGAERLWQPSYRLGLPLKSHMGFFPRYCEMSLAALVRKLIILWIFYCPFQPVTFSDYIADLRKVWIRSNQKESEVIENIFFCLQ